MKSERTSLIPNSTQVPNILMDLVMPRLPSPEHERVLRYICRRTFGFGKKSDRIGLMQFVRGITSKEGIRLDYGAGVAYSTARGCLDDLDSAGIIQKVSNSNGSPNGYRINLEIDPERAVKQCLEAWKGRNSTRRSRGKQANLFGEINPAGNSRQGAGLASRVPVGLASSPPAGNSRHHKTKRNKEKQSIAEKISAPSRFNEFLGWYGETAVRARHLDIPLVITAAVRRNLGNFLKKHQPSWELMEQLALYFLANHRYKKFSPGIETFVSAGIMNGLLNDSRNEASFWKDVNAYVEAYLRKEAPLTGEAIQDQVKKMLAGMKVPEAAL